MMAYNTKANNNLWDDDSGLTKCPQAANSQQRESVKKADCLSMSQIKQWLSPSEAVSESANKSIRQ